MSDQDQYWVFFGWCEWMRMSAEAAAFWFTKGLLIRLCDHSPTPQENQYGIYLSADVPPFLKGAQ